MGGHHSATMLKDEWLTPPEIIRALGKFDLDPCSPINRPWDTADSHYTASDNGLSRPWVGRVWCNPPYGRETGKWLERCADHGDAVALIFARTETQDWVRWIWGSADAVMFLFGRLHFYHVDGRRASANSGAPSALVAYGRGNVEALRRSGLAGHIVEVQRAGAFAEHQQSIDRLRKALNRRAVVEQVLLDVANGKRDLPTREECRKLALKLGVPEEYQDKGEGE